MASRYFRKTAILFKPETTYLTDPTPSASTNALLVSNMRINPLAAQNVPREVLRHYFGGSEHLVGTRYIDMTFDVEIAGSGAAGTAPAWGPLLRCAGFAEAITADTRVDYTPISASFEGGTVYWYDDGVLHKAHGCRGDASFKLGLGGVPVISFHFMGIDGGISEASVPTATLTAWKAPIAITDPNTGDVTLGASYSSGSLSGGNAYPSRGIELALGNELAHVPLLGGESVDITGRDVSGKVQLDLTAAQEVSLMASVKANTLTSLGFQHGSSAGYIVLLHAPAVQLLNPSKEEINGKRLIGYDLRLLPSSGNDELRIVVK